jgi:hypothetical protein
VLANLAVVAVLLAISAHDPSLGARLVDENDVVEWLQVLMSAAAGVLAFRQGRAARRAGQPATLEVAIVATMAIICIGEVDLDRLIFGTKVISTRYFVHPRHSLAARVLAFIVVVGAPTAVGVWLLVHVRNLWRASLDGLRSRGGSWPRSASCSSQPSRSSSDRSVTSRGCPCTSAKRSPSSSRASASSSDSSPGNGILWIGCPPDP